MPIIMNRAPSKANKLFSNIEDQEIAEELLARIRADAADEDRFKNLLELFEFTFTDEQIYGYIKESIEDINSGYPRSDYRLSTLGDLTMIKNGAIVHAFMAKGILEMKNSVPINDQGVQINTYDKGPNFQAAAQYFAQEFQSQKANLKSALYFNNMFVGIYSDFSYM